MRILQFRKTILMTLLAGLLIAMGTVLASAQRVTGGQLPPRPIIIRQYYFYDPFRRFDDYYYYDRYALDPYYRERRRRANLRDEVREAREELNERMAEYRADGVITAKEQRRLDEAQEELNDAIRELEEYEVDAE